MEALYVAVSLAGLVFLCACFVSHIILLCAVARIERSVERLADYVRDIDGMLDDRGGHGGLFDPTLKQLQKVKNQIDSLGGWMNKHNNNTGAGPPGPPVAFHEDVYDED